MTENNNYLNDKKIRSRMMFASLYIAAFEIFKHTIIENVRYFFVDGFKDGKLIFSENYEKSVLDLHKNDFIASIKWIKKMGAIDEKDMEFIKQVTDCRNEIVHNMDKFLLGYIEINSSQLFSIMLDLLGKVEKWWVLNVEIPTDVDFVNKKIDEENIISINVFFIKYLKELVSEFSE